MQLTFLNNGKKILGIEREDLSRYHSRMRHAPMVIVAWDVLAREQVYKIVLVSLN